MKNNSKTFNTLYISIYKNRAKLIRNIKNNPKKNEGELVLTACFPIL